MDSIATVRTPHCLNQSANRCRSPVKVPKLRTGSETLSGPTAATCIVAPMSIAAASGCVGEISRLLRDFFVPDMKGSPIRLTNGGVGLCQKIKFLTGIAENGVATLKCAAAHGPRYVTGLDTTKLRTASPLQPQTSISFLSPQAGNRPATGYVGTAAKLQIRHRDIGSLDTKMPTHGGQILSNWQQVAVNESGDRSRSSV